MRVKFVPTSSPVMEREQVKPVGGLGMEFVATTFINKSGNLLTREITPDRVNKVMLIYEFLVQTDLKWKSTDIYIL